MATTGWLVSSVNRVSNIGSSTTPFEIADWPRAQRIANGWAAKRIHRKLDEFARGYCPVYRDFASGYHWSVDQCEYATDIVVGVTVTAEIARDDQSQHGYERLVRFLTKGRRMKCRAASTGTHALRQVLSLIPMMAKSSATSC